MLHDRPAEGAAELLILDRRRVAAVLGDEIIRRIGPVIVAEVITGAVQLVGAALHHHVARAAALDADLRRRRLLYRELGDRVHRHEGGGNADDAGLVEDRIAVVAIVVRNALGHVVGPRVPGAADADGEEAAAWIALDTGRDAEQRVEVAAAER